MIDASAIIILPVPGCEICEEHVALGVREACIECRMDALADMGISVPQILA